MHGDQDGNLFQESGLYPGLANVGLRMYVTGKPGLESAWRLALPLSHQIASWENSRTCGSDTEAPTGNESHAMTPTKEPQPAQICWEQGSFRRGPLAESGLGSLPGTGQEAGADVDLWQRDDTCDSEDRQSPPNPDKSVGGGGQHKATPLGAGV